MHARYGLKLLLIAAITCAAAVAAAGAEGWAFIDENGNGVYDAGEEGVADAVVSDGVTAIRTDADGRFAFDVDEAARFVFLSSPSGTRPVGAWYVSAETPTPIAFPLERTVDVGPLVFVQLSDLHYAPDADSFKRAFDDRRMAVDPAGVLDVIVAEVNAMAPDFVILTGDIVANAKGPELAEVEAWMTYAAEGFVARIASRSYATVGNHDVVRDEAINEALYERFFGPTYYSFTVKGTHCVVLNPHQLFGTKQTYSITATQLEWLRQDLALADPDAPILVFCHEPSPDWAPTPETAALIDLLADSRITALLNGHWHTNYVLQEEPFLELTSGAVCASWWEGAGPDGTEFGYRTFEMRRGQLDSIWRNAGENLVSFPKPETAVLLWADRLEAQVWGRAIGASYRWDGGEALAARVSSNGLWTTATANLNVSTLAEGYHTLSIAFTFDDGSTVDGTRSFYVGSLQISLAEIIAHPEVFQGRMVAAPDLQVRAVMGSDVSATDGTKTIIVAKFPFVVKRGDHIAILGLYRPTSADPIKGYDAIHSVVLDVGVN